MTPTSQRLVRESFAKLAPDGIAATAIFYDRLFALDPSLRALFKDDMAEQGRKLMSLIGMARICINWKPLSLPSRTLAADTPVMALLRPIPDCCGCPALDVGASSR